MSSGLLESVVRGGGVAGLDVHMHTSDHSIYLPRPHLSVSRHVPRCTPQPQNLPAAFLECSVDSPGQWDTLGCSADERHSQSGVSSAPDPDSAAPIQAVWNSATDTPGQQLQRSSTSAGLEENCSWVLECAVWNRCPGEAGTSPVGRTESVCSEGSRADAGRRTDSCSQCL